MITVRRPRTLTEEVGREIIRQIVDGHLKPGDKFPPESELMSQLHMSRGVVLFTFGAQKYGCYGWSWVLARRQSE